MSGLYQRLQFHSFIPTVLVCLMKLKGLEKPLEKVIIASELKVKLLKVIRFGIVGRLESPNMTLDESIEIAQIQDLVRQKVGAIFPEDSKEL